MTAGVSDVGEENIAGGFAMIERYARLAVRQRRPLALEIAKKRPVGGSLTDCSIGKNYEETRVINPFDLKAAIYILPF
jgi:hypothetical protein